MVEHHQINTVLAPYAEIVFTHWRRADLPSFEVWNLVTGLLTRECFTLADAEIVARDIHTRYRGME
jgi:hypothetical protein